MGMHNQHLEFFHRVQESLKAEGSDFACCEMDVLWSADCSMSASCLGERRVPYWLSSRSKNANSTKFVFEKTYPRTDWAGG